MQNTVIRERKTLLIGVLPPVLAFTLLLPYPPNAGRAMNKPPMILATPRATSSRLAETFIFTIPSASSTSSPSLLIFFSTFAVLVPRLLAATLLSKKPSRAIKKEVEKASVTCWKKDGRKGKCALKGFPLARMSPRTSRPC